MARTLDGVDDQIAFGSDVSVDQLAQFTAYALIRPTATITDERQVLTKMNSSYLGKMYLALMGSNELFTYINRDGGSDCYAFSGDGILTVNQWNVIVSTWAGIGNVPVLYHCLLGGTLTNVTSTTQIGVGSLLNDSSATLRVGARDPLDATFYAGGVADCGLWSRVLNSTELADLGLGKSPEFHTTNLVFATRMTGTDSPEINTTGGTNGTVTGTTLLTHPGVTYPSAGSSVPSKVRAYMRRRAA